MTHNCRVCGIELSNYNWQPSYQKNGNYICKECNRKKVNLYRKNNPEKTKAQEERARRNQGRIPFYENKDCSSYFGINIVERALRNIYNNVQRMPMNNPGYDFICGKGKKIDSKGSCIRKNRNNWVFAIRRNTIPDYFCCIAFDNREDLTPLHIWLIPGHAVNHLTGISISPSTLDKWSKYEKPINELITCCDSIRAP